MCKPQVFFTSIIMVMLLTSCASKGQSPTQMASNFLNRQDATSTTELSYPAKSAQHVAFFSSPQSPTAPYRIIGVATVFKHNLLGVQRPDSTMNTMMKQLAASMGGDGVINLSSDTNAMQGHVIAYQKVLI